MKRLLPILGMTLIFGLVAQANIIATEAGIVTSGSDYVWTYNMQLSIDQNVNAGLAPTDPSVPPANLTFGGFVTVYDFAGYVAGSCSAPTGWTCSAQLVGFTPSDVIPTDNASLENITWVYTSGPTLTGQPAGLALGAFSAESTFSTPTVVSYASRGAKNLGGQVGTISDNVGTTEAPSATPEPVSAVMLGGGLIAIGVFEAPPRQ